MGGGFIIFLPIKRELIRGRGLILEGGLIEIYSIKEDETRA